MPSNPITTTLKPSSPQRFESLDAFRGISASLIVFFHLHLIGSFTESAAIKGIWILVEFFFVLSGFVLAHSYGFKQNFSFKAAIGSRFFRLYPLHFFMLGLTLAIELGKFIGNQYFHLGFPGQAFTGRTALTELAYNASLLQAWLPWANSYSFNFPAWSISIEFYTYIIFFITVYLSAEKFRPAVWLLFPFALAFMVFLLFGLSSLQSEVFRGIPCFFWGAASYLLYQKLSQLRLIFLKNKRWLATASELLLLGFIVWLVPQNAKPNAVLYLLSVFSFCMAIILFAFEAGAVSQLLQKPIFLLLGKLSYSIYLTHTFYLFLITLLTLFLDKYLGSHFLIGNNTLDFGNSMVNNLVAIAFIVVVIAGSYFSYHHVELKWQTIGKRFINKQKKAPNWGLY